MDLTICVVHYRTPELLAECLQSVLEAAPGARVIVVDTGGGPLDLPAAVELHRVPNRGYSSAVNYGLKLCKTGYFVQMNADVVVTRSTFRDLLTVLRTAPGAGMVGPVALNRFGALQGAGGSSLLAVLRLRLFGWSAISAGRSVRHAPLSWLSGCLQAVDIRAVEAVGGMDESFRFYNEDMDWCLRFRSHGFACMLVDTPITHYGGASTVQSPMLLAEGLRGGYVVVERHQPAWHAWLQRQAVLAWATFSPSPAAARVRRIFRYGDFHRQLFGDTLDDTLT